ncbi:MAG: hypothetical protein CL843_16510 [Crocinitomicaceae bacterium]|nr:hypothetical protein [Crocinitomicaceae bacterium]|tara:strand:- start:6233 stop:7138 length:906 start_codon:yes stop_codon:yes gene_type:complete
MKLLLYFILVTFLLLSGCQFDYQPQQKTTVIQTTAIASNKHSEQSKLNHSQINPEGKTIATRFNPPVGFERINAEQGSYAAYLRNLPLKPHGTLVKLYNGEVKSDEGVYDAVVDLEIGQKDLHQCADAVMRLRAEYLWNNKHYDQIHFNFTNGFRVDYSKWMQGQRVSIKGNKTQWYAATSPSNTYTDFWKYMELVFSYAGTLSLAKELEPVAVGNMQIGDVFIYGGSPGHSVIVVDMVQNPTTGEKRFLLAQSYMPAQEIQILKNPNNVAYSPWYSTSMEGELRTPEWTFYLPALKRFQQ